MEWLGERVMVMFALLREWLSEKGDASIALVPLLLLHFQLILNFHYSPKKAKPSLLFSQLLFDTDVPLLRSTHKDARMHTPQRTIWRTIINHASISCSHLRHYLLFNH